MKPQDPEAPAGGLRVLITRAEPGATRTAERLTSLGHTPVLSPLLCVEPMAIDPPIQSAPAAWIFTSPNAVQQAAERNLPKARAFCVGEKTATDARAAGFYPSVSADGDSADLQSLLLDTFGQARSEAFLSGPVFHVASADAEQTIVQALKDAGVPARFVPLYRTAPNDGQIERLRARISSGPAACLFHSPKAARVFSQTANGELEDIHAIAISDAAADPITGLRWRSIVIAERPNEDAVLEALQKAPYPARKTP